MRRIYSYLLLLTLSFFQLEASYNEFEHNPNISAEAREMIRPYLLPEDHPIRSKLDQLFKKHITKSIKSFTKAGFVLRHAQPRSFIRVVGHEQLTGYLLKIQLDDEDRQKLDHPVWWWFVKRCQGAEKIAHAIEKYDVTHFTVAKKWIYPLPVLHEVPLSRQKKIKPVLLVVEDMQVLSKEESTKAWRKKIKKVHLNELHNIIKTAGGSSYRPDNIPYTKNRTFAFVDTEYPDHAPNYKEIEKSLSKENKPYWENLMQQGL